MAQVPQESASKPRPFYGRNESQMPRYGAKASLLEHRWTPDLNHPSKSKVEHLHEGRTAPLWTMATGHGDAALPSWTFSTFGELGTGRPNLSVQQTHWDCAHLCASWIIFSHAIQSCHHQHHHPAVSHQVSPPPFSGFHLRRCLQPTWQFHQRFHDKALPPRDSPPDAK